jgi:hypothetical protein
MTCPHELIRGGSQIIAIQIAAELRDRGHQVEIYAFSGPLTEYIASLDLPYRQAPSRLGGLRPYRVGHLAAEIRRFQPDIVHTYEAQGSLASGRAFFAAPHRNLTTVSSMNVPDFVPQDVPLLVGTAGLVEDQIGRAGSTSLMEPLADTRFDTPGDAATAKAALGIASDQSVVVVDSRLSEEHHKAQGVIDAIRDLDSRELPRPITLIVAGTGDREADVVATTSAVRNPLLTVRLEGDVPDPRTIYDAADITFGMGSSGIRAMAHAKPLIVQGRDGFCRLLDEDSADELAGDGVFGYGQTGGPSVGDHIIDLLGNPRRRAELAALGRALVLQRFSLQHGADIVERACAEELLQTRTRSGRLAPVVSASARYLRFRTALRLPKVHRLYRRLTGRA